MTDVDDPLIGRLIDGRYQVDAELARGGMATVYRARDLRLDRAVALKVMRADLARDDAFVRRFVHEAHAAARLQHPHIVNVYDQGEDGSVVYLAMELVEGRTLRDVIRAEAPLSTRAALTLLIPVTEALAAAHADGMIHRDVKPENVLLGLRRSNQVKVADFGLARIEGVPSVTTEMLWATAAYLAPEQVEHDSSDARTDVYAVGLLLFELVTGHKAFPGDDPLRVAYEHVHGGVPRARELVPSVPVAVEELILRASASDPQDRPQDGSELLTELRLLQRSLSEAELEAVPYRDETVAVPRLGTDATQVVGPASAASATRRIPVGRDAPANAGKSTSAGTPPETRYARTTGNRAPAPRQSVPASRRQRTGSSGWGWVLGTLLLLLLAGGGFGYWYLTEGPAVHSAMPVVVNLSEQEARSTLDAQDLDAVVEYAFSEDTAKDVVMKADHEPGAVLRHGTDVLLTVSRGLERYAVPRLDGLTVADATTQLAAEHLTLGEQTLTYHESVAPGQIVSSNPTTGSELPPGTPVDVVVSQGPAPVDVIDVSGKSEQEARDLLGAAGLTVEVAPDRVFSETVPDGAVVSQDPGPGQVERGRTVQLVLSKGPALVRVPSVIGRQFSQAERELTELGLVVTREDVRGGFFGTVREQSIEPDTEVPKGSQIVLAVV
ncbi:MAG: Stk1 family PASTA domain-containing Ser/Thr kinase [Ornithinimicrobium sp.]|uniref:Stk1 family PASTA domain-containing Ser/Thr kinase n=1 Tax=Ornithinimicrobium sp. TaxID=1977084 RepID=UPI0026DFD522|nr:Stk1 family PASTA domain-containing Ser/Thr kinase [Ornithinimicrobium sp.]MDO5740534.1 Stk1 family PASTA domain-containing Ser/Thr kinase [Ornithinimicrobium sp.]